MTTQALDFVSQEKVGYEEVRLYFCDGGRLILARILYKKTEALR